MLQLTLESKPAVKVNNYQLAPKLLLRSPLLPLETIFKERFDENALKDIYTSPVIMEALFLASPGLHSEAIKWLKGEIKDEREKKRIQQSLMKYLIRMSSRCTPFGLFAGCNLAGWDKETKVLLKAPDENRRHTRLDMHYLCALARALSQHDEIKPFLKFYPNQSIYEFHQGYRYFEGKYYGANIKYEISEVDRSPYLQAILKASSSGARLSDLASLVVEDTVSYEDAFAFVEQLVKCQLLTSELEPAITGAEFLDQLLTILDRYREVIAGEFFRSLRCVLEETKQAIHTLDRNALGNPVSVYEAIAKKLEPLKIHIDLKLLFQVDMVKVCSEARIDSRIAGHIRKGVTVLNAITPKMPPLNLSRFITAFQERYENREVPLLQALDNESGVGYLQVGDRADITPVVDDVQTHGRQRAETMYVRNDINLLFLQKYLKAIQEGSYEVEINDAEVESFKPQWHDLADSLMVMGSFIRDKTEHHGCNVYLKSVGGFASASGMLGRFTHSDAGIDAFVRSITDHEQQLESGRILAEIVHLPQSRLGNILLRTRIRPYEIPFLAKSSVDKEHQVTLDDVLVSVDASGNIRLRSARFDKEIIPRLASAHNFSTNALPVYHFLCDLQMQHIRPALYFNWDQTGIAYPFKPRLRYANVLLHRATWLFSKKDLLFFTQGGAELTRQVAAWRSQWKIPRRIVLAEGDNELLIDLENPFFIDILKQKIRNKESVQLAEFILSTTHAVVKDEAGDAYSNEFVMTFLKKLPEKKIIPKACHVMHHPEIKREFSLGDQWMYYKLYAGNKTADSLIAGHLADMVEHLKKEKLIKHWFFVRYADPKYHLRFRICLAEQDRIGNVILRIHSFLNPLLEQGVVSKVQTDTYVREVERYGSNTIESVETLFHHQSELIMEFLKRTSESNNTELFRFLFAMKCADKLMDLFKYDFTAKRIFAEQAVINFEKEFSVNTQTHHQLSEKYKYLQKTIISVFDHTADPIPEWEALDALISAYNDRLAETINEILNIKQMGRLEVQMDDLLWSLNHMFVNRLARSKARKHEFIVYAMLHRYYNFVHFRKKNSTLKTELIIQ